MPCLASRWISLSTLATLYASLLPTPSAATELPFLPPYAAGSAFAVSSLAAADFDGDGDLDLAMISETQEEVFWLEDTGAGFVQHLVSDTIDAPNHLAAADIDCDGEVDLVIGETGTDSIVWARNVNAASSWSSGGVVTTVANPVQFAVGDVIGNGVLDVVGVELGGGGITLWRRASCSAAVWTATTVTAGLSVVSSVALADIDDDGLTDVAATDLGVGLVGWWKNPGTPGVWIGNGVDAAFSGVNSVTAADVDGDGDVDLAAVSNTSSRIAWWANPGDLSVWPKIEVGILLLGARLRSGDIDRDGDVDLVASSSVSTTALSWWDNLAGDGSAWEVRVLDPVPDVPRDLVIVDLGADGDRDIVSAALTAGEARVFENASTSRSGQFPEALFNNAYPFPLREIADLEYGDINGDGDLDLVVAERDLSLPDGFVYWLENNGLDSAGQLTLGGPHFIHLATLHSVESLALGDFDSDGDIDVFVGNTLTVAENGTFCRNDGGLWTCFGVVSTGIRQTMDGLTAADIDGDGDLDLVASMADPIVGNTTTWWENAGDPSTSAGWLGHDLGSNDRQDRLAAIDIDGDGDLDVMESLNRWWRNTAAGWVRKTIPGSTILDFSIGDVDVDGDPDVAALIATPSGPGLAWFENDVAGGTSSWFEHEVRAPDTQVLAGWQIALSDLDVDGDPDFVANLSEAGETRVVWLENRVRDAESWVEQQVGAEGPLGARLLTADFDRDGDDDLVAAEESDIVQSWINGGGQFALAGSAVAPHSIPDGEERAILEIELDHRGRLGEAGLRLAQLALLFEQSSGVPLDSGELATLVTVLRLYLDDGSLTFDPALDLEVASFLPPTVVNGLAVLDLPSGESGLELAAGADAAVYFLSLELTADASTAGFGAMILSHVPTQGSAAENLDYGTVLMLEHASDLVAEFDIGLFDIFADGFESGDTSAWSLVVD